MKLEYNIFITIFVILLASFFLRSWGIFNNHPFWVDEFSTAVHAQSILKYGVLNLNNSQVFLESHNFTTHFLVALFFKLFGQNEWTARIPFVIIGSLIPLIIFLLTKYILDTQTGILASLFITFSYFEISWSRQARGYMLLQFLILMATYLYFKIVNNFRSFSLKLVFVIVSILGILTHSFFYLFLFSLLVHFILFNFDFLKAQLKKLATYFLLAIFMMISYKIGLIKNIINLYSNSFLNSNNLWYYHSFLWREYGLITFLGIIGLLIGLNTKKKATSFFIFYALLHLIFICFFFPAYTSRYLLPIFPLLIIFASYTITYLVEVFLKSSQFNHQKILRSLLPTVITLFIIINGHKFVTKPKTFYSVNHDFREIALLDYEQVYDIVRKKGNLKEKKTVVIDPWNARAYWYLGSDYELIYIFRWINEPGLINGLPKKTDFVLNKEGEKVLASYSKLRFIGELADLKKAMKKYPRGFIFIDDSTLPKDVIEYAENNFKKELYLNHYPLDDNPYSIWPATLYSWGI